MAQNKFYTIHFLVFFGLTLLMTPPKNIHAGVKPGDIKTEVKQPNLILEDAANLVHTEASFKY